MEWYEGGIIKYDMHAQRNFGECMCRNVLQTIAALGYV